MPSPTRPPHSLTPLHGAPALRHGGQRRLTHLPPPPSRQSRSRRLRSCTEAQPERRQASHPHVRLPHARAVAQRRRQRHPLPGIGSPARPRASTWRDPAIKALFLLLFPLQGSFAPPSGVRPSYGGVVVLCAVYACVVSSWRLCASVIACAWVGACSRYRVL